MSERLAPPEMPEWLSRQLPFERYRVVVGKERMHVMETGRGLPVLLLHGNPTWGFLYRRVARELARDEVRLIMPDLIGLGFSDKPSDPAEHRLSSHIDWMSQLIDALDIDRCVLAIQDWGGAIGVGAVAARPALRVGLVVMNTVVTPPKPGFRPTAFHRFARMPLVSDLAFRVGRFPQSIMRWTVSTRLSADERRAYTYPLGRLPLAPLALARMVPNGPAHPSIAALERCRSWVERFDGPAAIVWGDRDPVLGRVRRWMEALFPQAEVTRTNAGHFLQEEVPEAIAAAIRSVAGKLAS